MTAHHNAYGPDKPWFYDPRHCGGGCVVHQGIHLVDLANDKYSEPAAERVIELAQTLDAFYCR